MRFLFTDLLFILILCLFSLHVNAEEKPSTPVHRPKIGLCLSGGGAKGFAHIGVLKVLEEEGIPIDYITGTSMGSVVGSLYASGYSAAELETLAITLDWDSFIKDKVSRRNILMRDRDEYDKYPLFFDFSGFSLQLPKGLIKGQALQSELSLLTIPYHSVTDYSKLPIPFKCIATDIETGNAVVLSRGYLPESVRASMSIPSLFTPVELGSLLLVDGGIARNFPVSDLREMGADIVIGVDVGQPLYRKDELDSFGKIMEQSVSFLGNSSTKHQRTLTDLLILPDIHGISSSSFGDVSTIIARGESAAREKLPEIRKLAAYLKKFSPPPAKKFLPKPKTVVITEVTINGLSRVSKNMIFSLLNIDTPATMTPDEIREAIQNVYGSNMFERLTFRLIPARDNSYILELSVTEKTTHVLQFGFSYDTYMKEMLLANLTLRNMFWFGNKFTIDAKIGESPGLKVATYYYAGGRSGLGIGVEVESNSFDLNTYTSEGSSSVSGSYNLVISSAKLLVNTTFANGFLVGAGLEKKVMSIDPIVSPIVDKSMMMEASTVFVYSKIDTYDRYYYPTCGFLFEGKAAYVSDYLNVLSDHSFDSFMKYSASFGAAIPVFSRVSFHVNGSAGIIESQNVPVSELFYLGGMYTYNEDFTAFPGLNLLEVSGTRMFCCGFAVQTEPFHDLFFIPRWNVGRAESSTNRLVGRKGLCYGYGVTIGSTAFPLPLEFSAIQGDGARGRNNLFYINAGYRF